MMTCSSGTMGRKKSERDKVNEILCDTVVQNGKGIKSSKNGCGLRCFLCLQDLKVNKTTVRRHVLAKKHLRALERAQGKRTTCVVSRNKTVNADESSDEGGDSDSVSEFGGQSTLRQLLHRVTTRKMVPRLFILSTYMLGIPLSAMVL